MYDIKKHNVSTIYSAAGDDDIAAVVIGRVEKVVGVDATIRGRIIVIDLVTRGHLAQVDFGVAREFVRTSKVLVTYSSSERLLSSMYTQMPHKVFVANEALITTVVFAGKWTWL